MSYQETKDKVAKLRPRPVGLGHADDTSPNPISRGLVLILAILYLVWLFLHPRSAFKNLFATMAWVSVIFAMFRLAASALSKPEDLGLADISPTLPKYTVLVPLFHETQMIDQLMAGLERLRYPKDKIEIILITEEADPFTTQAVQKALRPPFKQIIVPKGVPQTKPRALNYALERSNSDFVTIYDAEDRPHPDQLLAAIAAFEARPDWAAVQAPLEYFNHDDNWLTRQFTLEYAALFHVWVPFLVRLNLPFPLGGTSNHIRRSALDIVGGWDAHNVTEDADLSFRLAAHGFNIGYIHPPTQEEAVSIFKDWRFQRARWIKGYIQTWDVHMRKPFAPGGLRGIVRFLTLQMTLGITLLSILFYTPVIVGFPIVALILWWVKVPLDISLIYGLTFLFSICIGCLIGVVGARRSKKPELIHSTLTMPVYWLLLFEPALRAIKELKGKRFHWHKTRHGVSRPADLMPLQKDDPDNVSLRRPAD